MNTKQLRAVPDYVQPVPRTGLYVDGMRRDLIGIRVDGVVRTENIVAGTAIDGATHEDVGFVRFADGSAVLLQLRDGEAVTDEDGNDWPFTQFSAQVTTAYGASNTTHVFFGVYIVYDDSGTTESRSAIVSINKATRAVRFTLTSNTGSSRVLGLDLARAPENWGSPARSAASRFAFAPPGPVYFNAQHLVLVTRENPDPTDHMYIRRLGVVYGSGPEPQLARLEAQEAARVDGLPFTPLGTERLELDADRGYELAYCGVLQQGDNDSFTVVLSRREIQLLVTQPSSDRPLAIVTDAVTGVQPTGTGLLLNIAEDEDCTVVNGTLYPQRSGVVALFGNSAPGGTAASISPTVWLLNAFTEQLEAAAYANGVLVAASLAGNECVAGCAGLSAYSTDGFAVVVVRFDEAPEFPDVYRLSNALDAQALPTFAPLVRTQADVRAPFVVQAASGGTLVGDVSFQQSALKADTSSPNSVAYGQRWSAAHRFPVRDFTRRLLVQPLFRANGGTRVQEGIAFPTQRNAEFTSGDAGAANVVVLNGVLQVGGSAGISDPAPGMIRWTGTELQVYDQFSTWRTITLV